jgi:uncharacterized membrane protein YheB (UPF0754 family)
MSDPGSSTSETSEASVDGTPPSDGGSASEEAPAPDGAPGPEGAEALPENEVPREERPREGPRRASGERLRRRILRAVVRHMPRRRPGEAEIEEPPRVQGRYALWLPLLRAVPWLLLVAFALSFAWDFSDVVLRAGGVSVALDGLLRITSVSGLIGFGTNWLAITMLFRPREPRPIVGQGVVPAQRERVAWRLAQAVSDELINEAIITEKIRESGLAARYRDLALSVAEDVATDAAVRRELKAATRRYLHDVLQNEEVQERIVTFTAEQLEENAQGLSGLALRLYRTFGEDDFQERLQEAVEQLPQSLDPLLDELDPMLDRVPALLRQRSDALEDLITQLVIRFVESIDIQRIVLENVRAYDERQLESLLQRTTNEQLTYIKYLGGVLGVVGGLVIWAPGPSLVALTGLALTVYALDEALYRMR